MSDQTTRSDPEKDVVRLASKLASTLPGDDPRMKALLAEMEALARIMPSARVMSEDTTSDEFFDNMPV